jgi:hypothetical protein
MNPNIRASYLGVLWLLYISTAGATTYVATDAFWALTWPQSYASGADVMNRTICRT